MKSILFTLNFFLAIAALSLIASGMLWQKLSNIQEQLARQSADSGANAIEARTVARQAQEWRLAVTPYRASSRRAGCPGLPEVDRARPLAGTRVVEEFDDVSAWEAAPASGS